MIEKIDQIDLDFEQIFDYCNNNEPKVENDVYEEVIGYDSKIRTEWEQKIQEIQIDQRRNNGRKQQST